MAGHPVAFVDETFIQIRNHPGAYMFAAVLVNDDELATTIDAARRAAGDPEYHSTDLYRRGHLRPIEDMLDATEAHAGWTVVTVQAPLGDDREAARQAALSRLLQHLNTQKVRDVVLDTRASPREQRETQLEGRKITRSDRPDVATYRALVRDHQISARMRLLHVDDRQQPALWMADVAAWAFQRALVFDEPQWFSRIAAVSTVLDAGSGTEITLNSNRAAPPIGERGPRNLSQSAQAPLSPRFYTLTGGTTNRAQGPGDLYTNLLQQITDARQPPVTQQLTEQIAALSRNVAELTQAIRSISNPPAAPMTPDTPPQTLEEIDHGEPETPELDQDPTID